MLCGGRVLCVVLLVLRSTSADPAISSSTVTDPSSTNSSHDGQPHGIRLASWRWDGYANIVSILLMIIGAFLLKLLFHHIPYLPENFPESCVLILVGIIIGVIVRYAAGIDNESEGHHFPTFSSELFFNFLLPPIILDSAYSLYDREFLSNLGCVLLFAVVGTIINTFVVGYGLFGVWSLGAMGEIPCDNATLASGVLDPNCQHHSFDSIQCLVFASLISAVDPVAVLAIFEEVGVNMGLYFLVFGESLLNDGVTVVIYNTMISLSREESPIDPAQYGLAIASFFTVVFGGLLIGIIFGVFSAFLLKLTGHTRVIEPLIIFALAYMAYILAETIHWSGIISLIGCGIFQKRYAFPNCSKETYTTVKYGIKTLSSISDCIIFLFLGLVTTTKKNMDFRVGFICWTLGFILVVRFVVVFSLAWLVNLKRIKKINFNEQFIMAYGGLRGAVGFSLVIILDHANPFRPMFVATTIIVIFFTVFLQGGTIKPLVNKLNIKQKEQKDNSIYKEINLKMIDHVMAGVEAIAGRHSNYFVLEQLQHFDELYVKRWLINKKALDYLSLKMQRIALDSHFANLYGPNVLVHEEVIQIEDDETAEPPIALRKKKAVEPGTSKDNEALKRAVTKAFRESTFEKYQHRMRRNDYSETNLLDQLEFRRKRTDTIGRKLVESRDTEMKDLGAEERHSVAKKRWKSASDKAAWIQRQYREAKMGSPNKKDPPKRNNSTDL